jgi:division protein CdvB (Snf7/Vps24/ESCRT-III family)
VKRTEANVFFFGRIHRELADMRQLLEQIHHQELDVMSKITDWAAKEQTDLAAIAATLNGIVAGITALDTLITQLEATVVSPTPEEQAALDAVTAASDALVVQAAAISTAPPAGPAAQ